jgi:uncharacterized protein YkwD
VRATGGEEQAVAEELSAKLPAILAQTSFARLGVGAAARGGTTTVVVALQESAIETEPIPRELPRGGALRLRGRVLSPYGSPRVLVTGPGGRVSSVPVVRDGPAGFRADVSCGADDGSIKIEIAAKDGAESPTVLANFAVYCGVPAPRTLTLAPPAATSDDPLAVARDIFDRANLDRAKVGLPALAWDDIAAEVARRHATEMRDKEFVAHISPTTGSASDRARAAGIATPLLLENLARAYSPAEAEDGLMNSPGHRANLLSPQVTHLGVGVALGRAVGPQREIYVTQLFLRKNSLVDPKAARRTALEALERARRDGRVAPLAEDAALDETAERYAAGLAAGRTRTEVAAESDAALDGLSTRFSQVMTIIAVTGDPADGIRANVLDANVGAFGLGLAQGHHADLGDAAYFIVILLAKTR